MQGQRHQHDKALILGQRILSIEHKLESILQHLRCPANLSNDSNGGMEEDHGPDCNMRLSKKRRRAHD
jgi:hypothetical protein